MSATETLFILLGFTAVLVGLILLIHRVLKVDEPDEHGEWFAFNEDEEK